MWVHIPSSSVPVSVPASDNSTKLSDSFSKAISVSCTASGSLRQQKFWSAAWKKGRFPTLWSTLTLPPSAANDSADAWLSSLPDCPAPRTPSPVSSAEKTTTDISGPLSSGSSLKCDPPWSSSKTFQISLSGFEESERNYQDWVTTLRQEYLQRQKLVLRTDANVSSAWLTPHGMNGQEQSSGRQGRGGEFAKQVTNWPSPRSEDSESCGNHPEAMDSLTGVVDQWPTAMARDYRSVTGRESEQRDNAMQNLNVAVDQWPTANAHDASGARGKNHYLTDNHYKPHDLNMATDQWQTPATDSFRSRGGDRVDEMGLDQQSRFWRTPDTPGQGGPRNRQGSIGNGHQVTIGEQAENWATDWPTPGVPNGGRQMRLEDVESKGATEKGKRQVPLESMTPHWGTPTSRDWKDGAWESNEREGRPNGNGLVSIQALNWPTPTPWQQEESRESFEARREREKAKGRNGNGMGEPLDMVATNFRSSPQDPAPPQSGRICWCGTHGCDLPSHRRKLNSLFAMLLMGWPPHWLAPGPTSSGCAATELWRSRQRLHLSRLLGNYCP